MDLRYVRSRLGTDVDSGVDHDGTHRIASVLVVIYGEPPRVLMTQKPRHLKFHAGEISFPGGKLDASDADVLDTALRETREELGLSFQRRQVIGRLDSVTTLNSGFLIVPFVAVADRIARLETNAEVEQAFEIPLEPLLGTMADDADPGHTSIQEMHVFSFDGRTVWGASARILRQIAARLM